MPLSTMPLSGRWRHSQVSLATILPPTKTTRLRWLVTLFRHEHQLIGDKRLSAVWVGVRSHTHTSARLSVKFRRSQKHIQCHRVRSIFNGVAWGCAQTCAKKLIKPMIRKHSIQTVLPDQILNQVISVRAETNARKRTTKRTLRKWIERNWPNQPSKLPISAHAR